MIGLLMEKELWFKCLLRPLVLGTVLETETIQGCTIIHKISNASKGELPVSEGTVYSLLGKLEKEGILEREVEEGNVGREKIYRLTAPGKVQIEIELACTKNYLIALNALLG